LPNIGIELLREILLPKHDEKKGMRNLRKKTKKKLYVSVPMIVEEKGNFA
jgi:hypothetical protein